MPDLLRVRAVAATVDALRAAAAEYGASRGEADAGGKPAGQGASPRKTQRRRA